AVGSGGVLGKGFTLGTQKRLNFLPEQHTDFIFSVVGEELGFVGTSLALVFFGYLFFRMIRLAQAFDDPFSGIFVFAILGVWLTHVVVNVGMTVGVVPITGIPLPFISYGGSFLLMSWVAAGLVVGMARDVR
ncbi:MAG: rod shape-determining protein RodA, partial [Gemmatimonadetes bacterium]|nr:rod shape-determining protein RodA [Gemmatimonadota bacterium]